MQVSVPGCLMLHWASLNLVLCTDQQCTSLVETPKLPMLSALMFVVPYTDNVHTIAMKEQTFQT